MWREPPQKLAAARCIVDVQQDVRAIIRLRTIAQHRRLNLVEINGGGTAAQFRSTAIFQRRHRTLLKEV